MDISLPGNSKKSIGISFINNLSLLFGLTALFSCVYFGFRIGSWSRILHSNPLVELGLLLLGVLLFKHILRWYFPLIKKPVNILLSFHQLELIIIIFGVMVFAMVVTDNEYDNDYTIWLHRYVMAFSTKKTLHDTLYKSQICPNFAKKFNHLSVSEFYNTNLTPLESGCCTPPSSCRFDYKNATIWEAGENYRSLFNYKGRHAILPTRDCVTWGSTFPGFCYDCYSCMGSIIFNIKMEWRHMVFANIFVLIFLTIGYSFCSSKLRRGVKTFFISRRL